jgi:serine O-acetyltransferase
MISLFNSDVRAKAHWVHGCISGRTRVKVLCGDGTASMLLYRWMQACQRLKLYPLAALFNRINTIFCNCIIGRGASFGREFVLIHSTGVVINSSVVGGDGVFIEHQVTIGAEKGRSPRIGDHVFFGAGCKVLGDITIGDDVKIGANAVVLQDVPAGCTAVGVPARIIHPEEKSQSG